MFLDPATDLSTFLAAVNFCQLTFTLFPPPKKEEEEKKQLLCT